MWSIYMYDREDRKIARQMMSLHRRHSAFGISFLSCICRTSWRPVGVPIMPGHRRCLVNRLV